jgi:hypothetical protein
VAESFIRVGYLNDLWVYNISSNEWTWVSGSSTDDVFGAYGTNGVPSVNNLPGSREGHSMVYHPSMNCLFMFGGEGHAASTIGLSILNIG